VRTLANKEPLKPSTMRLNNGLIAVCMGPSGAGKTSLLETLLPDYGPVCVLDIDGKAHVLRDHDDVDVYPCHTWQELDGYLQDLERQSLHPQYKTLVVDGTTYMQVKLAWGKHKVDSIDNAQLRQTAYGKANADMLDFGTRVRILAERGMYVIYNIWSMLEGQEGEAGKRIQPDLTGTMLTRFLGGLDFVVYLEPNAPPKPYPPVMRTGGSQLYATRTAVSPDSPLRDLPALIYNPSWASIFDSYRGEPWPTERHNK